MKKLSALALAAAVTGSTLAASNGIALAQPYGPPPPPPPKYYPYHHPHYYGSPFFFGFSFGPRYVYPQPYSYSYAYGNPHVAWCASHYRTYNPATNTYHPKVGVTAACVSPYWHY